MCVANWPDLGCTDGHGLLTDGVRVLDDQQHPLIAHPANSSPLALTTLGSVGTTAERQDERAAGPVALVSARVSAYLSAETRGRTRSQGRSYVVEAAGVLDDDSLLAGVVEDDAAEDESLALAELLDSVDEAVAPEPLSLVALSLSFFVVSDESGRFEAEPFL